MGVALAWLGRGCAIGGGRLGLPVLPAGGPQRLRGHGRPAGPSR